MTNKEFAVSLRLMADFYEVNGTIEQPFGAYQSVYCFSKEDLANWARAFGTCEKTINDSYVQLSKVFGNITLNPFTSKSNVCVAKVVGRKLVPETIVEGTPTRITPAHEEDIIEWECNESLLAEPEEKPSNEQPNSD